MNHLSTQTLQVCRHVIASQVLSAGDPNFEEAARLAVQAIRELDLALHGRLAQEATEGAEEDLATEDPVVTEAPAYAEATFEDTVVGDPVAEAPVAEAPVAEAPEVPA